MASTGRLAGLERWLRPLVAGGIAGACFVMPILPILPIQLGVALLPVQFAFVRYGRKSGYLSAFVAVAIATLVCVPELRASGLQAMANPLTALCLTAVLGFVNAPKVAKLHFGPRIAAVAIVLAAAAYPAVAWYLESEEFANSLSPLTTMTQPAATDASAATDANASVNLPKAEDLGAGELSADDIAATIEKTGGLPPSIANQLIAQIRDVTYLSYAFILFLFVLGGWWYGSRIAQYSTSRAYGNAPGQVLAGVEEGIAPPALISIRMPHYLIWVFLASWGTVLAANAFAPGNRALATPAWNLALIASMLYFIQGSGVVSHLMRTSRVARLALMALALLALAVMLLLPSGPLPLVALGIVTALGISETWIPYRNAKGVSQ